MISVTSQHYAAAPQAGLRIAVVILTACFLLVHRLRMTFEVQVHPGQEYQRSLALYVVMSSVVSLCSAGVDDVKGVIYEVSVSSIAAPSLRVWPMWAPGL